MHEFGRLCAVRRLLLLLAILVFGLGGFSPGSRAGEPTSPLTIVVFGDSQAAGVARGLQRVLINNARYRVLNRTHPGASFAHTESEWLTPIQHFVETENAEFAIVMFGGNDRIDMRDSSDRYLRFGTDAWRDVYTERVDRVLKLLLTAGLKVTWCGNPIARSVKYSTDMESINKIYEDEASRFGVQFLPLWATVVDDQGGYTAFGKNRDGVTERLRADDGIHFSAAGYELIAGKILGSFKPAGANAQ